MVGWNERFRYIIRFILGTNAGTLKREIQQMEEEKQQVLSKISRLKKKVEGIAI